MIFYFSGTGNSKFVAMKVAEVTGEKARDIADYVKNGEKAEFPDEERLVFVGPAYVSCIARTVLDFVETSSFKQGARAYFLCTCKAYMGVTPSVVEKLCGKKSLEYMGTAQIELPQNYITHFKMQDTEFNREMIIKSIPVIEEIAGRINNNEKLITKKPIILEVPLTVWTCDLYYKYFMGTKKFYATDECISCGKCAKVCINSNIKIEEGKPVWSNHCTHCMACINLCPKGAIEYGKGTIGKTRYPGPFVVLGTPEK